MPAAGRRCDQALIENDSHGCPCCPHGTFGAAAVGSRNVSINGFPSLRLGDEGSHGGCCGSTGWRAAMGWSTVLVNGIPIHCQGDATEHCGGIGALVGGSPNVIVGERTGSVFVLRIDMPMFLRVTLEGFLLSPQRTLEMILAFRHGWKAGLGALVGSLGQIWMRYGLGRLFGLLDKIGIPIGAILGNVVMVFGDFIPFISDALKWVHAGFQMLFNMLFESGVAPEHGPCPEPQLVDPPVGYSVEQLTMTQDALWDTIEPHRDVTKLVFRLLQAFRPVFVQHPDDHRGLSMEELLRHSQLWPLPPDVPTTPQTLDEYVDALNDYEAHDPGAEVHGALDIEDWFARDPGRRPEAEHVYHGRAIKCASNNIRLHYFALRSGSFLGDRHVNQSLYEHEGDGEGVTVVIHRAGPGQPWLLGGLNFEGKHYKRNCASGDACVGKDQACRGCGGEISGGRSWVACEVDEATNRPVVYVAIGSHALCPSSGPRRMLGCFVDYYPALTPETRCANYRLIPSSDPHVRQAVFTKKVKWGAEQELKGTHNYDGHEEYPEDGLADTDVDEMFIVKAQDPP